MRARVAFIGRLVVALPVMAVLLAAERIGWWLEQWTRKNR